MPHDIQLKFHTTPERDNIECLLFQVSAETGYPSCSNHHLVKGEELDMNTSSLVIDPIRLSTYVNPSQIISQHPPSSISSTSSNNTPTTKKSKRKRTDTPPDESCDSSSHPKKPTKDRPKKKKANRACFHCQKAHLTCDDCQSLSLSLYHLIHYFNT